jgi:hypothetical protein
LWSAFRSLDQFSALVVFLDLDSQILLELVADLKLAGILIFLGGFFALRFGLVIGRVGFFGESAGFREFGDFCLKHLLLLRFGIRKRFLAFFDCRVSLVPEFVGLFSFVSATASQDRSH